MPGHCCRQWLCDPPPPLLIQQTEESHDNNNQILINKQNFSTFPSVAEILHNKLQENQLKQEFENVNSGKLIKSG